MRWIIDRELRDDPGTAWLKDFVAQYDTAKVEWLRLDFGRQGKDSGRGLYGRCWPPKTGLRVKGKPQLLTFRLSCQVPGPWPDEVDLRLSPLYPVDGIFPPLPDGCRRGPYNERHQDGKVVRWVQVYRPIMIDTQSEAIVFIGAHECYHWLRKTRQVPGRQDEAHADAFAVAKLEEYRRECSCQQANTVSI